MPTATFPKNRRRFRFPPWRTVARWSFLVTWRGLRVAAFLTLLCLLSNIGQKLAAVADVGLRISAILKANPPPPMRDAAPREL